jgi:WD40 repeat protein
MAAPALVRIFWIVAGSLLLAAGPARGQPGEPRKPLVDRYGDPLPAGAIARLGTPRFRNVDDFYLRSQPSLAWTPDGRFVVSGGGGRAVVWDAETGKEIRRLGSDHAYGPASVSADGKRLVVGGWSGTPGKHVAVYEFATGQMMFRFGPEPTHTDCHARFSPDGALLATHGMSRDIDLIDGRNGEPLHRLKGHEGEGVWDTLFTPDGKTLVSVGRDRTIRLWDVKLGKQQKRIDVDGESIRQIRQALLSPDGKLLATVAQAVKQFDNGGINFGNDRLIRIWDLEAGKIAREILVPPEGEKDGLPLGCWLMGFTPEGGLLTRGGDDVIRVWDVRTGKELQHWADEHDTLQMAFSPDGKKYAAAEGLHSISIRDSATRQELVPAEGHRHTVKGLAISPDGKTVATTGDDGALILWDLAASKPRFRLTGHKQRIRFLAFSADGGTLYTVDFDNVLLLWDTGTGKERKRIVGEKGAVGRTTLSPDRKRIAWGGRNDEVLFLDAATGAEVGKLGTGAKRLSPIAFTADGNSLLSWSMGPPTAGADGPHDSKLLRWDIATGRRTETPCEGLPDAPSMTVFSPDRSLIAFGGQKGDLILVDVATGREVRRLNENARNGKEGPVFRAVFSPDGRTLAWAGPGGMVRLSEVATGKERRRLAGHVPAAAGVRALHFTRDGRQLISGGADTTCLVWDLMGPDGWGDDPPPPLDEQALADCWQQLRSADAAKAYVALRRLAGDPARAVPYLRQQLRPIAAPDGKRVARLLGDLDSEDFDARDAATRELEKTGDAVLAAVRKALAANPSLETGRRLKQLVFKLDAMTETRLQAMRAIEALEIMGSADARLLLEALAGGAPGAHQTHEAQASAARLAKR